MQRFTLVIQDVSDFGRVGLAGIHQVLETDRDVEEILYSVDRDGFDRVFVYVRGYADCTFDEGELRDLLNQLEAGGAVLALGTKNAAYERWKAIGEALTMKQYHRVNTGDLSYRGMFQRALKASKRDSVRQAAVEGLKYCHVYGWTA